MLTLEGEEKYKQGQENPCEFEPSLSYIVRPCLNPIPSPPKIDDLV